MSSSDHSMGHENDLKMVIENLRRGRCPTEDDLTKLAESAARLLEEKKVASDREKQAVERCEKVMAEKSKIAAQMNDFILGLLKKNDNLKDMNVQNECLMRMYRDKFQRLDMTLVKMGQERLAAAKIIEDLKRANFVANKTIDELRLKKPEPDHQLLAEEYRSGLEFLCARNKKKGEDLVEAMNAKAKDVVNFFNDIRKLKASAGEGTSSAFPVSNGSAPGDKHPVQPRMQSEDNEEPLNLGSSSAGRDIIDISDTEDETKPAVAAGVPNADENRKRKGKQIVMGDEAVPSSRAIFNGLNDESQTKKRKRRRMSTSSWMCTSNNCSEKAGPSRPAYQTPPLQKFNGLRTKWSWKREALKVNKVTKVCLESRRSTVEKIAVELKCIGDGVCHEFLGSCFGFLMRLDTRSSLGSRTALDWIISHEVVKPGAAPDELWFRVGGRFIRFSKYEYALVTGLSFRPTEFDPKADHHPPASGLFIRHYGGGKVSMNTLLSDFTKGVFRGSPADALKVAKLLIVYFLLFGIDGRARIDDWAWTLIEDSEGWETLMWGHYTFKILMNYLKRLPTDLKNSEAPTYHIYGYIWPFLFWAYEAIPILGDVCGLRTSNDALPRCLRWRFPSGRVEKERLNGREEEMEVHRTLMPSEEERKQAYWKSVCPNDPLKMETISNPRPLGPAVPPGFEAFALCRERGWGTGPSI